MNPSSQQLLNLMIRDFSAWYDRGGESYHTRLERGSFQDDAKLIGGGVFEVTSGVVLDLHRKNFPEGSDTELNPTMRKILQDWLTHCRELGNIQIKN